MSSISVAATLLFFLFLASSSSFSFAAFFVLQANWTTFPGSSGNTTIATNRGTFFPAISSSGKPISSNESVFTLGFLRLNSTYFLLSVVQSSSSLLPTIVWSLNSSQPIIGNCSLSVAEDGIITLKNSGGSIVGTLGDSAAKAIGMLENGNLVVYNTTDVSKALVGHIIWHSWDHPSDVLLPGQVLRQGTALNSGRYTLTMYTGGAVMDISGKPYMTLPMTTDSTAASVINPCFATGNSSSGESWAEFTGSSLILYYSGVTTISSKSCTFQNSSTFLDSGDRNETSIGFLRLDNDGNLRTYTAMPSPTLGNSISPIGWRPERELVAPGAICNLPDFCGSYGLCSKGQCSCPGANSDDQFDQVEPNDRTAGCRPKNQINCTSSSNAATHFLRLPAFHYFLADFTVPQNHTADQSGCESLCLASCGCLAYFYHNFSGACFILSGNLYTLKFVANDSYLAGIKVQNATVAITTSSAQQKSYSLGAGGITGITIGVLAFIFATLLWVYRRIAVSPVVADGKEEEDDQDEEETEEAFLKTLPGLPPRFTYAELREATTGFAEKLGTGGFGTVFSGKLLDGAPVAVKRLDTPGHGGREFRAEVATIGSISHVNLVRLRGFCADRWRRLLVYELMPNGSLDKWLFEPKACSKGTESSRGLLNWHQRYNVAVGTAHGLAYLHDGCREPILHLDIKPQNILLDDRFQPKLSDFGMSRLLDATGENTQVVTAVRGTPGYLAPEWIRYSVATKKCDVYSFGMVLLEMISGRRNFVPEAEDQQRCYFPAWAMLKAMEGRLEEVVDGRLRLEEGEVDEAERMTKVAFWCIQEDPTMRPCISTVVKMLEGEMPVEAPPLWLVERAPRFLEAFGFDRFGFSRDKGFGPASFCIHCTMEISGPR